MAHLHKKIKKGRPYYYVRESQRIGGKPQVVNQVYLGSAEKILSVFLGREKELPRRFSSKEFGSIFVLTGLDREIDLAGLVDKVVPRRRKSEGPSCGELLLYAVINRAISPRSKRQLTRWYERTDIQSLRPVRLDVLSPQNFWNHWDRIGEEELERIAQGFFGTIHELFPCRGEHFLFDTTNFYTYLDSRTPSKLAKRGHNKAGKHHLRQVGLALITERTSGLPVYYRLYPGNQHDSRFFGLHLEEILGRLKTMGQEPRELTLIFDKGMNAEENICRIDADERLHFITSYSPYFAPELAATPLKHFRPLACPANDRMLSEGTPHDRILYLETSAVFWGKERKVIITFNPRTFRKKRYDLKEKLGRLREELYELRKRYRQGDPHWRDPEAVRASYLRLCEALHLNANFYQLSFFTEQGRPAMAFTLNRYQTETHLRRLAKTILITDHLDWSAREIYEAYRDRHLIEDQFRTTKSPFQVALMPQYHWTDSKVRIHAFVCIAALTYLRLLRNRLAASGLSLSVREIMEELRALRSAIYWIAQERKPRRILEEPTPEQLAILHALGYQMKDGRVLQK
jgi:transposase